MNSFLFISPNLGKFALSIFQNSSFKTIISKIANELHLETHRANFQFELFFSSHLPFSSSTLKFSEIFDSISTNESIFMGNNSWKLLFGPDVCIGAKEHMKRVQSVKNEN